ncbi:hypothetical protein M1N58_03325, partial [Dehalococcoidales bacterium]|nr:hypothetical protein [Dehalococcoidales bacterium]
MRGVQADLGITDGEPEIKGIMARTQSFLLLSLSRFHSAARNAKDKLFHHASEGLPQSWLATSA